jgi:hypothetical protein
MNITKLSAGFSCLIFFFISSVALAETSLEVTNCKGTVTEITTELVGFWAEMDGGGNIYIPWENVIKVAVPDCNPDSKIDDTIPSNVISRNGDENNTNIKQFVVIRGKEWEKLSLSN